MGEMIQDYIKTVQADFQLVFNHVKKGFPKKDKEKQERITHAAIRALLVPVIACVAIHFVASVVVGSLSSVIYMIGVAILLHDAYQWFKNKSPSYLEKVGEAVQPIKSYIWPEKTLFKNVPSHRWTKNMVLKPFADLFLYQFFPHL